MKRLARVVACLALAGVAGCHVADLLFVPAMVEACVRWRVIPFDVTLPDGSVVHDSWRICEEVGWTRRVDTIPAPPRTFP